MDFDDTPAEAAFRAEALAWLMANASLRVGDDGWGYSTAASASVEASKAWQAR